VKTIFTVSLLKTLRYLPPATLLLPDTEAGRRGLSRLMENLSD